MSRPVEWDMDDLDASLASAPLRILIVEDQPSVALVVAAKIERIRAWFPRAMVMTVHTMQDALETIHRDPAPDSVVLDLWLPDSDMKSTIAMVASISSRSAVVILTGDKSKEIDELLVGQEVEVIRKTGTAFQTDEILRAVVRSIMKRKNAQSEERLARMAQALEELQEIQNAPTQNG